MPNLDEIIKSVNKKFDSTIMHIGLPEYKYVRIPFTSPRLNYMTFGGLPVGKLIEFYGENGSGKTTTSLDIVANYQAMEDSKKVLWADCENTLDVEWAKKLNVDINSLYIIKPTSQSAEEIFQIILDSMETGEVGLVVIDSLGVMVSQQAMDKDMMEKTYGGISSALTTFSKKAEMLCQKNQCTLIGINQVREDMNSMYGGITTPGGKAWKHACSCRLEFRKGSYIDNDGKELTRNAESPAGNKVQVHMVKNKTCPPTRKLDYYTLKYAIGVDYLADLIDVAVKFDIINKRGAWFNLVDPITNETIVENIQGQSNVYKYLSNEENIDVLKKIESIIDEKIQVEEN